MFHSLRFRLLCVMIVVPMVALAGVWIAVRQVSHERLDQGLRFSVVPVARAHGGLRAPSDVDSDLLRPETPTTVGSGTRPVLYEPSSGDAFLIQADPDFVAAYDKDQLTAKHAMDQRLAIATGIAALAAAALAFAFWRRIIRPVETLTGAVRAMESGDLSARVAVPGRDEIGTLGTAFNAMAASIERDATLRKTVASDIAHELRTPLNNLSGYLDAIADGVVQPSAAVVNSLQEEAALLTRLVGDLEQLALADAGRQELSLDLVDAGLVMAAAVDSMAPRARAKGVTVRSAARSVAGRVLADPDRLGQVVRNLLENAIRHTPDGGTVDVAVRPVGTRVELTVSDTGPGIPPQQIPLVFERFYRGDPSRAKSTGGAGLGLAIARQLVEAHGGSITAENQPSGGARFTVSLPAT